MRCVNNPWEDTIQQQSKPCKSIHATTPLERARLEAGTCAKCHPWKGATKLADLGGEMRAIVNALGEGWRMPPCERARLEVKTSCKVPPVRGYA